MLCTNSLGFVNFPTVGEKMTEEECEMVFQGHEDAQGNVNYEGII